MSNSITASYRSDLALEELEDIYYQSYNYYYFIGKIDAWGVDDVPPMDEAGAFLLNNTLKREVACRDDMLYIKKLTPNDVSLVIPRYDWTTGTVYDQWDDSQVMTGKMFFVVNSDFNVYKCIDNVEGAVSTVMPASVDLVPFRTTDGYLWKYMYNIPLFKRTKFMSPDWIPVQKAISNSFYNKGALQKAVVTNGGSGYDDVVHTTMAVTGTTAGSSASIAIGSVSVSNGEIETLVINDGGTSYIVGTSITITKTLGGVRKFSAVTEYEADNTASVITTIASNSGTNAVIKLILTSGVITNYVIVDPGYGYLISDAVTVTVGGAELIPYISSSGAIVSVASMGLGLPGAGYTSTATTHIAVNDNTSSGGGAWGNSTALFNPVVYNGAIVAVNTIDQGVGYAKNSTTTITVQGDGTGCEMTPVVYQGSIIDVVVDAPGTGYTSASIIVAGSGSGAALTPVITQSDFDSDQSLIEQVAKPGAIYSVKVTNGGSGYTSSTVATITGDGDGNAQATVNVLNGQVVGVVMTSFGQNYTKASITFSDPIRNPGVNTEATAYVIFPPINGHGYDAVSELQGKTLGISTIIRQNITSSQLYYRQYGLIKEITEFNTNKTVNTDALMIVYQATVDTTNNLVIGESLVRSTSGTIFKVIDVVGNVVSLQQAGNKYEPPTGQLFAETEQSRIYNVSKAVAPSPNVNKYSGNLLFSLNSTPFTFSDTQGLLFKTFIKF
jgi:hypothetical protein